MLTQLFISICTQQERCDAGGMPSQWNRRCHRTIDCRWLQGTTSILKACVRLHAAAGWYILVSELPSAHAGGADGAGGAHTDQYTVGFILVGSARFGLNIVGTTTVTTECVGGDIGRGEGKARSKSHGSKGAHQSADSSYCHRYPHAHKVSSQRDANSQCTARNRSMIYALMEF